MQKEKQQSYQWVQNNGNGYLQLPLLGHPSLFHFFGTRLLASVALKNGREPIRLRQVHKDQICHITNDLGPFSDSNEGVEGDGLATNLLNRLITVSTADCLPVLLFDPIQRAIAAVHAGWRGSVMNISAKAVGEMESVYGSDPRNILAGVGPSIGSCCFEVKEDVVYVLEKETNYRDYVLSKGKEGSWHFDLTKLNMLQLIDAGLPSEQISTIGLCTACLPNLFYSFRRDKQKKGNMVSGIMLF